MMTLSFLINAVLLGIGLAMDAFSVSLANGLKEPLMGRLRMCAIAGVFGFFQFLMPLTGWFCVKAVTEAFRTFQPYIPWISLVLLCTIGGKMAAEGIRGGEQEEPLPGTLHGAGVLLAQGIATSLDALSVGFTIADYDAGAAVLASVIIGLVTFFICMAGIRIGRKAGTKLAGRASILGGTILIVIGIEILIQHLI